MALPQKRLPALLLFCALPALHCGDSNLEWIRGAHDQEVLVGEEIVVEIRAASPTGQPLQFDFHSDGAGVNERAELVRIDDAAVVFRFTPLVEDIGTWRVDLYAQGNGTKSTESFALRVLATRDRSPHFQQPIGVGSVLDLERDDCLELDIVVDDADTGTVKIAMEEPFYPGATLIPTGAGEARFTYCPQKDKVEALTRRVFRLSADDGENPKVIKSFLVLLKPMRAFERVPLGGWVLFERRSSCAFLFPEGFKVPRDSLIVIARNSGESAFRRYWFDNADRPFPKLVQFFDDQDRCFKLTAAKEQYFLYDNQGRRVDGPTLEVEDGKNYQRVFAKGTANLFGNWSQGFPGDANPGSRGSVDSPIPFVSEVSDVPEGDDDGFQFIEITIH
jgi:hypothetical protein